MTVAKTALAASVILATLGLAGCQTTEERVYYSEVPSPVVSTTVVYDEPTRVYRPPAVYVDRPYYVGRPGYWDRPVHRRPPVYGGPTPDPRWHPRRPPQGPLPGDPGGLRPPPRWDDPRHAPRVVAPRGGPVGMEPGNSGDPRPPRGNGPTRPRYIQPER